MRKPTLTLHASATAPRKLLLAEGQRRSTREAMSGFTAEPPPGREGVSANVELIVELRQQRAKGLEEHRTKWHRIANQYQGIAKRAKRDSTRESALNFVRISRELAADPHEALPVGEEEQNEPYVVYAAMSSRYAGTFVYTAYDHSGAQILKARVTGNNDIQIQALGQVQSLAAALAQADRNGLRIMKS